MFSGLGLSNAEAVPNRLDIQSPHFLGGDTGLAWCASRRVGAKVPALVTELGGGGGGGGRGDMV